MKLYSAPLQGYTEAPWRNAHETAFGGVDAYYAPFMRIEKGDFRNKDLRDLYKIRFAAVIQTCEKSHLYLSDLKLRQKDKNFL